MASYSKTAHIVHPSVTPFPIPHLRSTPFFCPADLTFFIDSLMERGGAFTLIGCASPAAEHHEETKNTLKFTSKAREVTSRPVKQMEETETERLKRQVRQLMAEANRWRVQAEFLENCGVSREEQEAIERRNRALQEDVAALQRMHLESLQRRNPFVSPVGAAAGMESPMAGAGGPETLSMIKKVARARQYVKELRLIAGSSGESDAFFHPPASISETDDPTRTTDALVTWANAALHHVAAKPFCWVVQAFVRPEGDADEGATGRMDEDGDPWDAMAGPMELGAVEGNSEDVFFSAEDTARTPHRTPRRVFGGPGGGGGATPRTHGPFSADLKQVYHEAQEMESRCDTALQGIVSLARDDAAAAALQVLMETVTKVLYDSMEKRDAATGAFSEQRALIEDQQRELENLRAECGFAAGKIEEQARALEAATAARAEAEELSTFQQLEYATTRDRVTALESELSVAAAEIASLRLALGEREAAAEAARAHEAAQRDGAVADLTAQLLAAQEVSHTLTAQLAAANAALEGSQGAKSAETAALTQALEGAQAETARLRAAFEAQLAGLQTALDQSTATIDDTRAVADRAAAEAEAAVAARSEELRAMAAEFEAMSTRLAEAAGVTSAAVAQIAAMEKDVAAMTAARAALEAQVTALQASEQAAREELRVVSGQFESARNQNECLVGAEAALREQVIALVKDVEALTAANAALQADASTRVQLVPSAELEAAVTARAAAETAAAALQSAFNEKESELQAASAQITAASAAMNEKTAAYETELESTRQAFAAASAVVEARTAELSAARNDLSAALAAVEQKAAEADALQLQLRATEERAMGLQESLSALQGSAVDMTTELAATRNALSAAQAAAEEKEMQIATLAAAAAALEQQAAERTALLVELEAAQQTAAATAAALATAQGALEEKARESTALAAAAEGLQARLAGGADELAALQGTVAELQVQLEQARSCVAAREQRIEMLQQEMFGLTVRLDESQGSHNARWQIFKLENQGLLDKQKLLKAAVEEAERRAEEANAQISALNLARAQAVARAEELTTERDRLASDLARVTASAAATLEDSELVTSRVAGLEALNRALEASEEALTRRVVEQAAELARLQNVASETESLRLQLQDMAVQSPKDGGRDPDSVRMEVERLAGELRAARDEVAALQAQLEETKYELEGASHALKTARTERGKLEQKLFAVQAEAAEREAALEARLSEREGRVSALGDVSAALAALQSQVAAHQAELSRIASDKAQLIVEVEAGRRRSEALEGELAVAVATAAQAEEQLDNLRARYGDLMASHARAIDARVASPLAPPRSPKALIASHPLTHMEAEGEGEGEGAEGHAMRTLSFEFAAGATTLPHSPADRAGTRAMYDDEDDEGPEVHVQLDSPHSSDDQDGGTPRFCADFAPTPATAAALALRGADSNHVAQRKRRKTRGPDAYEDTLPEEVQRLSFSFGMHMPATIGEGSEEATLPAAAEAGAAEELPVAYDFEGGGGDGGEEMVADESAGPGAADAVEGAHAGSEGGPAVAAPNADRNSLRERILEAQRKRKELQVKTQRAKQAAAQAAAAPAAVAEDGSPGAPPAPENIPPAPATGGPTPKIKRKLGKRNWAVQETDNEVALLADRSNGGSGILGKLDGATREQLERLKSTVNPRR